MVPLGGRGVEGKKKEENGTEATEENGAFGLRGKGSSHAKKGWSSGGGPQGGHRRVLSSNRNARKPGSWGEKSFKTESGGNAWNEKKEGKRDRLDQTERMRGGFPRLI